MTKDALLILVLGVAILVLGIRGWHGWGKDVPSPFHPGGAGAAVLGGVMFIVGGTTELARQALHRSEDWWLVDTARPVVFGLIAAIVVYIVLNLVGRCPDFLMPPHQRRRQPSGSRFRKGKG